MGDFTASAAPQIVVPNTALHFVAQDETFWSRVRAEYATPAADFTHFEFGWYHPCSHAVLAKQVETLRSGQLRGSQYKRGEMNTDRESVRVALARVTGANPEEVIITRNTTWKGSPRRSRLGRGPS